MKLPVLPAPYIATLVTPRATEMLPLPVSRNPQYLPREKSKLNFLLNNSTLHFLSPATVCTHNTHRGAAQRAARSVDYPIINRLVRESIQCTQDLSIRSPILL